MHGRPVSGELLLAFAFLLPRGGGGLGLGLFRSALHAQHRCVQVDAQLAAPGFLFQRLTLLLAAALCSAWLSSCRLGFDLTTKLRCFRPWNPHDGFSEDAWHGEVLRIQVEFQLNFTTAWVRLMHWCCSKGSLNA